MKTNYIHPTAIVDNTVTLGEGNYIGPFCYITGNTKIGNNNRFEGHCSIGTPAEHREYFYNTEGHLYIGDNNVFREYSSINTGAISETRIGSNIILLTGTHVSHDCVLSDKITLSHNAVLGGHSTVMEGVNLGIGAICHQYSILGAYAMVGMGSVITKTSSIKPGGVYVGSPAKYLKPNTVGLSRNGIDDTLLQVLTEEYYTLSHIVN